MNRIRLYLYTICFFILHSCFFSYTNAASRIVVIGSSTAAGYLLTPEQSWVGRYRTHLKNLDPHNQVINLAKSGYTTYNVMADEFTPPAGKPSPDKSHNITLALSYSPDAIIINLPTNDIAKGYSIPEILNNFAELVKAADSHGVPVWITTTQPREFTSKELQPVLSELNEYLYDIYGDKIIDFWTDLATEDGIIKSTYKKDNAHLNSTGHNILFNRVLSTDIHKICDKGPRRLYLIGGATDALWNGEKSIPFIQDPVNPNIHTLVCELRHKNVDNGTQFRILNQPSTTGTGLFAKKKNEALTDGTTSYVQKKSTLSNSNYRWTVPANKQGNYKLTIDLSKNTLASEYLGETIYAPDQIYLIGGATEAGWNETEAITFEQDPGNPNIFRLSCLLKNSTISEGNKFKIIGIQDSITFSFHPKSKDEALSTGCTINPKVTPAIVDYKWTVPTAKQGYYILTLDIASKKLTSKYCGRTEVLPATLYLIGGATEAGWSGEKSIPFEQDSVNPNIFRLDCLLKHNSTISNGDQFRILQQPDISKGKGLFPKKNKQLISTSSVYVEKNTTLSNSHYRWLVPQKQQGYYTLTVDILTKTLSAKYWGAQIPGLKAAYGNDDFTDISTDLDVSNHPVRIVAYDNTINVAIDKTDETESLVQIFNIDGRIVLNRYFKESNTSISGISKGIYVVKVLYSGEQYSEKVIVK